ncbi:hypothetical protein BCAR13_1060114 [Paraburkholderia caribensis]|nr:hypothetical protein BCAR13_1060114 [Paraburkholderia caribensis]
MTTRSVTSTPMSVAVTAGSHSSSSSTSFFNCRSHFIAQLLEMNRGSTHKNQASTRDRLSGLIQINRAHFRCLNLIQVLPAHLSFA